MTPRRGCTLLIHTFPSCIPDTTKFPKEDTPGLRSLSFHALCIFLTRMIPVRCPALPAKHRWLARLPPPCFESVTATEGSPFFSRIILFLLINCILHSRSTAYRGDGRFAQMHKIDMLLHSHQRAASVANGPMSYPLLCSLCSKAFSNCGVSNKAAVPTAPTWGGT